MKIEVIFCPIDGRYLLRLDFRQVYPNDTWLDTPVMVEGPDGAAAPYRSARESGDLIAGYGKRTLPPPVRDWLIRCEPLVKGYVEEAILLAKARRAPQPVTQQQHHWLH